MGQREDVLAWIAVSQGTAAEAARRFNVAPGTVRQWLARAKAKTADKAPTVTPDPVPQPPSVTPPAETQRTGARTPGRPTSSSTAIADAELLVSQLEPQPLEYYERLLRTLDLHMAAAKPRDVAGIARAAAMVRDKMDYLRREREKGVAADDLSEDQIRDKLRQMAARMSVQHLRILVDEYERRVGLVSSRP